MRDRAQIEDWKAEWKAAGVAIRRAREARRDHGGRPADEVKRLREQTAETAAYCADCFTPLAPNQSVTLVSRVIEHVPAAYSGIDTFIPPHDIVRAVPICLTCWLSSMANRSAWWSLETLRLRCEGCGRPLRVESKPYHRLPLRERCCCAACLRAALRRRNNSSLLSATVRGAVRSARSESRD
jgi:hypothetical protein